MDLRQQITRCSVAVFFLLALLLQPIHQLEHHFHENDEDIVYNVDNGFSVQNEHSTYCSLCQFVFFSSPELDIEKIEVPSKFSSLRNSIGTELTNLYSEKYKSHKQLRAPPFYA